MDDQFLQDLRREPRPEFARDLKASLDAQSAQSRHGRFSPAVTRWVTAAASIAAVSIAFTFPSVRAGAQAFLDLFRVVSVRGISFDPSRLESVDWENVDLPRMLGGEPEVLIDGGGPQTYDTLDAAANAAGAPVLVPAYVPAGWERTGITVTGEHAMRVTADTALLQAVMDQLGINDLTIPPGIDGESVTVHVPPVVQMTYDNANVESGELRFGVMQARTPEVAFPAGVDLASLAEIALRILGLDDDEAYNLAQSIDWRTTLVVPVPAAEASFQQVDVGGRQGLIISQANGGQNSQKTLLWASDSQVFAIAGRMPPLTMLEIAQTMQ
jgi:hypothetical protein